MKLIPVVLVGLAAGLVSAYDSAENIMDCLGSKDVPTYWPTSTAYPELAEPFNLRLPYKPAVIVLPTVAQHVQDAVVCAQQCGFKVQARGGGHSYASFSSGGKDGSMVINLEEMHKVELDKKTNIAKVGGGVRLGNMAQSIYDQGKRALPHGTCPGVGIGGHATHGGYGYTSRTWGIALDTIVAVDVVLADGSLKHASQTENSEIFWALRGAADSFGIVLNFYLQTEPAPDSLVFFQFGWDNVLTSEKSFVDTVLHFQDFATNASVVDDRIAFGMNLEYGDHFTMSGTFFGSAAEFNETIKPELLRGVPKPTVINTVEDMEWIPYLIIFGGLDNTINVPETGYDMHDDFFAKSITVPEKDGLSHNALASFYRYISKGSPSSYFVIINLYGGPGSAINTKDTEFAAYNDRDSLWVFQNYGEKANSVPGIVDWINGVNDAVIDAQPLTEFGAYLNYVDPSYSAAEAHKVYYGEELYSKLLVLKKKYDPSFIFWNPQAIGV
ncbi:FAD-binding domain-containing protein [Polyplosphaeria fusca]|uniref:FAD-binding domain-containing protein n=1 Tax=Polyplosphaeria fusca TaxID=682080 RepID=A0A9P4QZZ1_9PLEO|nr:FAD-binding domain-containing protein [Polyplosphaeria fusca]